MVFHLNGFIQFFSDSLDLGIIELKGKNSSSISFLYCRRDLIINKSSSFTWRRTNQGTNALFLSQLQARQPLSALSAVQTLFCINYLCSCSICPSFRSSVRWVRWMRWAWEVNAKKQWVLFLLNVGVWGCKCHSSLWDWLYESPSWCKAPFFTVTLVLPLAK